MSVDHATEDAADDPRLGGAEMNALARSRENSLRIVVGCVLLAVVFGIAHDLVTAHIAVEYFTVHHARIVESTHPIVMALIWGVLATWWFGLVAGILLAWANSCRTSALPAALILRRVCWALVIVWFAAMGVIAAVYALSSYMPLESRRPTFESDRRLVAVAVAHNVSYLLAGIATLGLLIWTWRTPASKGSPDQS